MSVFVVPKNVFRRTLRLVDSNAHAYRLYIFKDLPARRLSSLRFVCLAAISEALNYDTVSCTLTQGTEEFFFRPLGQGLLRPGACIEALGGAKGKPRLCGLTERGFPA